MTNYTATVAWTRGDQPFLDGKYSRANTISFDGGVSIAGSSSPAVVRPPLSKIDAVDPEEMFVGSLSMCHMLFFLDLARKGGFVVDAYKDNAEGVMGKDERGRIAMLDVTLKPSVAWSPGPQGHLATQDDEDRLHAAAHELCYIANSFRGKVTVATRQV